MARRIPWRIVLAGLTAASMTGLSLLAMSSEAAGGAMSFEAAGGKSVAWVNASPSSGVIDGASVNVSGGNVPSNVHQVVLIECDSTQSSVVVGNPYDPNHCDTTPADEETLQVDNNNAFSGSFVFHDPLNTGGAGTVSCATGCFLLADNPNPGDVVAEMMVSGNSCNGVFSGNGDPTGSLVKTTSAGPTGSTVSPGQTISVTLTWNASDFGGSAPSHTDDCVEIGSHISASLSQEDKPGPAGGTDHFSYAVPSGGTNGQQICDRGAVSGPGVSTEKSAVLCYTVLTAVTPEVPKAILFPAAGLLIGGGSVLVSRRRRRRATEPFTQTSG